MPWLTGAAFWTFKDFSTPLRPENPIPYVNQKGVAQRDGTPKESYYVFQSYWSDKPMLHIYGHSWPMRWGKPDEEKEILVYSNCNEVELSVNGVPQGKRTRNSQDFPAAGLRWNVKLQPGENVIVATSGALSDTITQVYETRKWGAPAKVNLRRVAPDMLEAEVTDANGVRCLDCKEFIFFGCTDPSLLLVNQGTATGSRKVQLANGLAHIRLNHEATSAAATATVPSLGITSSVVEL